jgi:hypothetical protein
MKIGIVGAEAKKFTTLGELRARIVIREILLRGDVTGVCSGECHLGGIDIWAREEAFILSVPFTPFPPAKLVWTGGFEKRNRQIAKWSDKVYCLTVDTLPKEYKGMRFDTCYHCAKAGRPTNHIKSGGCWTALKCKSAEWFVIKNH